MFAEDIAMIPQRAVAHSGQPMAPPDIQEKVAFLSTCQAYPDCPTNVEVRQAHMSWIFLTDKHAWKLKKPVRTEYLDFSTPEARRKNCLREVHLNRRLAEDVYLGVAPLTIQPDGDLRLDGNGEPVDWLVQMRRLPANRMLDSLIAEHAVSSQDVLNLASKLVDFYSKATPILMNASQYRRGLIADMESAQQELKTTTYGAPADLVDSAVRGQIDFIQRNPELIESRPREGRIVEAHGDLRPEHVCLESKPVIIDCLEFNRKLRILDPASELAFLALECERLGGPEIGKRLLQAYSDLTEDRPAASLLTFYRAYHAIIRAKVAIWHLKDEAISDRDHWLARAEQYLRSAA